MCKPNFKDDEKKILNNVEITWESVSTGSWIPLGQCLIGSVDPLEKAQAVLQILSAMLTEWGETFWEKKKYEVETHRAHYPQCLQMIF